MNEPRPGLLFVTRHPGGVHVWVGPLGVHVYWPDVWKSRPDYEPRWRKSFS